MVLLILDGVGLGRRDESDGVFLAYTPVLDALLAEPLSTRLKAHGTAVGLPSDDDMGNSEVGHNALGAGRIFDQGATPVSQAIDSGAMFEGETWRWLTAQRAGQSSADSGNSGAAVEPDARPVVPADDRQCDACLQFQLAALTAEPLAQCFKHKRLRSPVGDRALRSHVGRFSQALLGRQNNGRRYYAW